MSVEHLWVDYFDDQIIKLKMEKMMKSRDDD